MSEAPRVSVVIPAYKAESTIERAVKSALGQPGVEVEVIVVIDDLSNMTAQIVDAASGGIAVILRNERNMGAPYSRNRGLEVATASNVIFLDSDDYITGDLLSGLCHALDSSDGDVAFGPWVRLNEDKKICQPFFPSYSSSRDLFSQWLVEKRFTSPSAVLWRASFVRAIGGWDESLRRNQDGELVLRGMLRGAKIATSNRGCGVYVNHTSEHRITSSRDNYGSLLQIANKLVEMSDNLMLPSEKNLIVAKYLYSIAASAFRRGDAGLGRQFLARARELGLSGHRGSRASKVGASILGIENYHRLAQVFKPRRR